MSKKTNAIEYHGQKLRKQEVESLKEIKAQISEKVRFTAENNRVVSLNLERTGISDLRPLRSLQSLRSLDLKVTSVSDLTPLQSLDNLQSLNISRTNVTDLTPLKRLPSLQKLTLGFTSVRDFDSLKHLKSLRYLNLFHVELSDLSPLVYLKNLKKLFLTYNPISDLKPLSSLKYLQTLDLAETSISDLTPLKNLQHLQKLSLYGAPVADIAPLKHLPSLKELDIRDTKVSPHNEVAQSLKERGVKVKGLGRLSRCYITTAVCQFTNFHYTDYILNTFRNWRDTYMKRSEKRRVLVRKYYRQAPKLVKKIRNEGIEAKVYPKLLRKFILPALYYIKRGRNHLALQTYKQALKFAQKFLKTHKL